MAQESNWNPFWSLQYCSWSSSCRDASYSRELVICNCVSQDFSAFPGNAKFQNAVEMTCPLLWQIPGIWNAEIYTDFGISNAILDQNQLQMTATLCIHQSSQNATNLPDSKWNADDRFSTIGCVSGIIEVSQSAVTKNIGNEWNYSRSQLWYKSAKKTFICDRITSN